MATAKKDATEIVRTIVQELAPFTSDERIRMIQASLTLLGDGHPGAIREIDGVQIAGDTGQLPAQVRAWMKQNGLSMQQIQQVFHIEADDANVIAAQIPGKSNRDKVRNAYILSGTAQFLATGEIKFDDKTARELCEEYGFYDHTNHSKYLKGGNEFSGSPKKGWTLTKPGLRAVAILIIELSKQN